MYKNYSFLGIIPARGGSKRLPKKNILNLAHKPLIAWTIDAALNSQYLDEVMVSSDDDDILSIAKQYGAKIPFKRPNHLADDLATRFQVIQHTIEFYKTKLHKTFDFIVFLQPTSPLRTAANIDNAIKYLFLKKGDAVVSVCELEHPIQWTGTLPPDNNMSHFLERVAINSRSQDLPIHYRLNGAIYICKTSEFLKQKSMFLKENIYAYIMDKDISIDIDTQYDFDLAEFLIQKRK